MATILLIDIDSKIVNFALKKIEKYHLDKGDEVIWNLPLFRNVADKIYVSCIFTKNKWKCQEWEGIAEIGGSGYSLTKKLPLEIEIIKPKINWGFTSRGCIRKCGFCLVPQKEGNIHIVGDIYDIWDSKSKDIVLMDNNILALPDHFKVICQQLRKEKLRVDFNQGLDIRLLTDELMEELKTIRHKEYHFAWDGKLDLSNKFKWLYTHLKRCTVYVLCGYNTTFNQDLDKFNKLKEIGHNGYCMRYKSVYNYKDRTYILLARWVNQHYIFQTHTWKEFLIFTSSGKYRKDIIPESLLKTIPTPLLSKTSCRITLT